MNIVYKKPSEIQPYKNNPRKNKKAVAKVAKSIKEFGFQQPIIVDTNMEVVAGHTRLAASIMLELEKIPVLIASDLTEEQIRGYRIADNRVSEFAEWNKDLLKIEIDDIDLNLDWLDFKFPDLENEIAPEYEFTEELLEERNYIIFSFKDSLDWLKIKQFFGVKSVHALDSKDNYKRVGIGRVLNGDLLSQAIDGGFDV